MYTTTLHVLNSAIVKLKNLTPAAVVYRGLSQKRMPASFKRVDSELNIRSVHAPSFLIHPHSPLTRALIRHE